MSKQNEEKMREAWVNTTLISCDPESVFYRGYQAAIAQERIESQKREAELRERVKELETQINQQENMEIVGYLGKGTGRFYTRDKAIDEWLSADSAIPLYAHPDTAKEE